MIQRKREERARRARQNNESSLKNFRKQNVKLKKKKKAVCLKTEKEFEDTKGLVIKEFNHDKPSGKVSWKAEKAGEYYFVDPEKCGRGVEATVVVSE